MSNKYTVYSFDNLAIRFMEVEWLDRVFPKSWPENELVKNKERNKGLRIYIHGKSSEVFVIQSFSEAHSSCSVDDLFTSEGTESSEGRRVGVCCFT